LSEKISGKEDQGVFGRANRLAGATTFRERIINLYSDHAVNKIGNRSPLVEKLLENAYEGMMVTVNTREGIKEVSIEDALEHYGDQLAAGGASGEDAFDVEVVGKGQTLTGFLGAEGNADLQARFGRAIKRGSLPGVHGDAVDEGTTENRGVSEGGAGARVQLQATPFLRSLIEPIIQGRGVTVDSAWGAGSRHLTTDRLPSGSWPN
jgi:hypothetical protein